MSKLTNVSISPVHDKYNAGIKLEDGTFTITKPVFSTPEEATSWAVDYADNPHDPKFQDAIMQEAETDEEQVTETVETEEKTE